MTPRTLFCIITVISGISANRLGRYDDDYPEDGYLRSGKNYSPNMHSYQAGSENNERYADTDRYLPRTLQKAPDYRRDDEDDDRDGHSEAYKYGGGNWMGQHYPAKSAYIRPTPATSTPACATPSCVTVSITTTVSRLVSICQLPTTYSFTGIYKGGNTVSPVTSETGTCSWILLPSKLIPDCCSGSTTASSYEPCYTTTFVRTILKDKTCTLTVETLLYRDVTLGWFDGQPTSEVGGYVSHVNMATSCIL